MNKKIRIGCASGFWGDTDIAAPQIIEKGNVDYLVCDYLSEVTMSILSRAKLKSSEHGYACLLYTSPSPRDRQKSRMPSSA